MKTLTELLNFGILVIDKPSGPTSFSVSDFVRRKLELKKTSHFGTLDPMVSGVLPVALGRACKLTGFFIGHDKEYVGIMRIHQEMKMREIQKIINSKFIGKIMQMPPVKSRVKRRLREREIKSFELLEQDGRDILFRSVVQGGTYIRKLIHDLGREIGGAHMTELRRTRAGVFDESNIVSLYDLEKASEKDLKKMIIPAEDAIKKIMPVVEVNEESVKKLLTGKPLFKEDVNEPLPDGIFAVFFKNQFIEIAERFDEGEIVGKPKFVFN